MKLIAGWIGVAFALISFLSQLWIMFQQKNHYKFFIFIQIILIFGSVFWMVYAFFAKPIYWPTGVNNIFVFIFNIIFLAINCHRWRKTKSCSEKEQLFGDSNLEKYQIQSISAKKQITSKNLFQRLAKNQKMKKNEEEQQQ